MENAKGVRHELQQIEDFLLLQLMEIEQWAPKKSQSQTGTYSFCTRRRKTSLKISLAFVTMLVTKDSVSEQNLSHISCGLFHILQKYWSSCYMILAVIFHLASVFGITVKIPEIGGKSVLAQHLQICARLLCGNCSKTQAESSLRALQWVTDT